MIALRPLQAVAVAALRREVQRGHRRVLLVAPTGFGKTIVIAEVARAHLSGDHPRRVLVVVHRRELVRQTVAKLHSAGIVDVGVLQADDDTTEGARVVVASVQTLVSRGRRPEATLVMWDECHHCPAVSFRTVSDAYKDAIHIGVTATPMRADAKPLGDVFEVMIVGATVSQLTREGLLVPSEVLAPGDIRRDLSMDPVEAYQKHTPGRAAVVFAASVAHARDLADRFNAAGIAAAAIDGEMSDSARDAALEAFASGKLAVLTNVFCLTEGWDAPRADVCILGRAPEHIGTLLQMVGRVLRPHEGKRIATVLDLRGVVHMHGLPDEDRAWSLLGAACVRTETISALRRCKGCLAIFRPARTCPRCGATHEVVQKIPRVLRRAERLVRLSDVPVHERDHRYMQRLIGIAETRMHMPRSRAEAWAVSKFSKTFGRLPGRAA